MKNSARLTPFLLFFLFLAQVAMGQELHGYTITVKDIISLRPIENAIVSIEGATDEEVVTDSYGKAIFMKQFQAGQVLNITIIKETYDNFFTTQVIKSQEFENDKTLLITPKRSIEVYGKIRLNGKPLSEPIDVQLESGAFRQVISTDTDGNFRSDIMRESIPDNDLELHLNSDVYRIKKGEDLSMVIKRDNRRYDFRTIDIKRKKTSITFLKKGSLIGSITGLSGGLGLYYLYAKPLYNDYRTLPEEELLAERSVDSRDDALDKANQMRRFSNGLIVVGGGLALVHLGIRALGIPTPRVKNAQINIISKPTGLGMQLSF